MFESVTRDVYPQYNTSADKIARPSTQERSLNFAQQGGIINNQVFSLLANKSEMNVHARTQRLF